MNINRRNALLLTISELAVTDGGEGSNKDILLEKCCQTIMDGQEYCLIWAGKRDEDGTAITPLVALTSANIPERDCMNLVEQVVTDMDMENPAAKALLSGECVVCQDVNNQKEFKSLKNIAAKTGFRSCSAWPLLYKEKEFGVISIHAAIVNYFTLDEISFLQTVIADISLALYSQEITRQMQIERDYNQEIVNTLDALLVSVSPCGLLLSLNKKAREITGFTEEELGGKYWVDVLIAPGYRKSTQQLLSNILKGETEQMNFESCLLTKDKKIRFVDWHASFRQNIEKGKVGLVLFGIDITGKKQTDKDLQQAIAQWENIFSAIQDPALIVSKDSVILDANHATFSAARKSRSEVIGNTISDVLYLGRTNGGSSSLEHLITERHSRIIETELPGLNGNYLLTVSPLVMQDKSPEAALLVARDLTEEELMKSEAMRAAQLASVGELAAGVAHEINNPINGIINYAQIILDDPADDDAPDMLDRIIKEGKRIASIVSNLLDFSRRRDESPEEVSIQTIIDKCIELVEHRFKSEMIILLIDLPPDLPFVYCNAQQIQQVLLNVFSNARHALNKRFPGQDPDKVLMIKGEIVRQGDNNYVRLTLTDNGTGIDQEHIERVFDPFYSTKPMGEGTGLGLSISHGLVHDNKGNLRVKSVPGSSTSLIIDLPFLEDQGGSND